MNGVRNATMVKENGLPLIMRQIIGRTSTRRMPKEDSTKGKPMFLLAECPGPPVRNFAQRKCGGNQRQSTKRFGRRLAQTRPYQHSYPRPVSPSTTNTVTLESKTRLGRLRQETISGQCGKGCWNSVVGKELRH